MGTSGRERNNHCKRRKSSFLKLKLDTDKKRLLENFFSLSILQGVNYILPLIMLPYLVRVLGPGKFGLIAFAQAFTQYFNVLTDYGFNLSATREISINRENKTKISEIFNSVMIIKAGLLILSFLTMSIIVFSFEKFRKEWLIYYLTFGTVIGQTLFPVWFFQGMERMKYITFLNIFAKLIVLISIFLFIQDSSDYIYVPLLNSLGVLISGILAIWIVYKNYDIRIFLPEREILYKTLQDSTQFFLSRLSSIGYSNLNIFLIGIILPPKYVTHYFLADKLINTVLSIFNPLVQTIYPYLSKNFNFNFFVRALAFIIILSFFMMIALFLSADILSLFLLKERNEIFMKILDVLLPVIPISALYVMLGAPLLLARGYKKEFNRSIIYGFLAHLFILIAVYIYYTFLDVGPKILYLFAYSICFSKLTVLLIRVYYVYINKLYMRK